MGFFFIGRKNVRTWHLSFLYLPYFFAHPVRISRQRGHFIFNRNTPFDLFYRNSHTRMIKKYDDFPVAYVANIGIHGAGIIARTGHKAPLHVVRAAPGRHPRPRRRPGNPQLLPRKPQPHSLMMMCRRRRRRSLRPRDYFTSR